MEDYVIIGGGIAGLSCAYWLEKKNCQVTLLEGEELGHGASGRNAGFLTGGSLSYFSHLLNLYGPKKALEIWNFTTENVALVKKELNLSKNLNLTEKGTISLFKKEELLKIEKAYSLLKKEGFQISKVDSILNYDGAFRIETDASYNPKEFIKVLETKLEKTKIYTQTKCEHILKTSLGFEIKTNSKIFKTKKIIFATNSHLYQFIPELKEVIKPNRAQIAYYKTEMTSIEESNYLIPSERIYFRKYKEGIIMGGLRFIDPKSEETIEYELNPKIQEALDEKVSRFFGKYEVVERWSGIMGFTQDEQPIIGQTEGDKDIYYIGGFSGHGNGYAFKLAQKLVDML